MAASDGTAQARFDDDVFVIGNPFVERRWRVVGADLMAIGLTDVDHQREWVTAPTEVASMTRSQVAASGPTVLRTDRVRVDGVGAPALQADLITPTDSGEIIRRFLVFDDFAAIGQQLITPHVEGGGDDEAAETPDVPTGTEGGPQDTSIDTADVVDAWAFDPLHCRVITTTFVDQTDHHNELLFEHEWALHPSERKIEARGNLWYLEHRPTECGLALLQVSPGPDHRFGHAAAADLVVAGDHLLTYGHGGMMAGYRQWIVAYQGDARARAIAIQQLQLRLRPFVSGRDGLLVSNTWGDRSRDSRMTEDFLLAEVAAAERLGIDVVQLDDGWQKGLTANAWKRPQDGAWGEYWKIDPDFWMPRPTSLPRGLEPVIAAARAAGVGVGLWFSPDSSDELSQWKRDRDRLVALVDAHGITQAKLDAILLSSPVAEERLRHLLDTLLEHTDGTLTFDLDVTAQVRLGYWGALHTGPIFVENRYSDFHSYWPHQTLRTLWKLAHHIHPVRLRMEFLNPYRNVDHYADDPLAPANYPAATLFATVMMASPLAWFELSESPPTFRRDLSDLIMVWKQHREAFQQHAILPIGAEPDGYSWTGFCSAPADGDAHAVVFRPVGSDTSWNFPAPPGGYHQAELLHGDGDVSIEAGIVHVEVDQPLGYAFLRLSQVH